MAPVLSLKLTLLFNESVPDASAPGPGMTAGAWEYAAATGIAKGGETVKLIATKRISGSGPNFQPTASMLTACVQFDGNASGDPPRNLTLQGVHDIASNNESGSVSAASSHLAEYIGGPFTFDFKTLLLTIHPRM